MLTVNFTFLIWIMLPLAAPRRRDLVRREVDIPFFFPDYFFAQQKTKWAFSQTHANTDIRGAHFFPEKIVATERSLFLVSKWNSYEIQFLSFLCSTHPNEPKQLSLFCESPRRLFTLVHPKKELNGKNNRTEFSALPDQRNRKSHCVCSLTCSPCEVAWGVNNCRSDGNEFTRRT